MANLFDQANERQKWDQTIDQVQKMGYPQNPAQPPASTSPQPRRPTSFGDAAAATVDPGVAQIPNQGGISQQRAQSIDAASAAAQRFGGYPLTAQQKDIVGQNFDRTAAEREAGFAAGKAGLPYNAIPQSTASGSPPATPSAIAPVPGAQTDVQRGGASAPAIIDAPASLAAAAMQSIPGVTRTGNSYTGPANIAGDISVNGQAPRGSVTTLPAGATPFAGSPAVSAQGFSPSMQGISAQNMGAADNLAARGQMESMGRLMASGQIQAPGAGPSFIMQSNTGFRRDPRLVAQEDAARRTLRYAQGDDPASRERKAKFQIAQLEQQGLAQRNQATNDIAQKALALKTEAQGFTTRAAQRMEDLGGVLLDPKSTPEQRSVAQRYLAALSRNTAADRMQTVTLPDTTNEMGQVMRGGQALVRTLEDGSVQQVPIGAQQGAALPPGMKRQIGTSNGRPVYEDMNGKQVIAKG